jgi:small GTP-binding protein
VNDRETAILLTPPGGAAIAVVRIVGHGVGPFLGKYFSKPVGAGQCVHGSLVDGRSVIDDPVVVLHAGGAVADINVHGGPWVVQSVLELARREGFEVVERPGAPSPDEAVDADTELGQEVLRYLPMARTELALRALLAQEAAWRMRNLSSEGRLRAQEVLADRSLYWLLHPPRVAIVGAPNAGKSTLANQLFAQERSITSDLPGTTRDWVGEIANVDGLAVMLVDTPGVRETPDEIERDAIGRAKAEIGGADLVVLVLDPTQPPKGQQPLIDHYRDAICVINKSDRPATWDACGRHERLHTVATNGHGVDDLRRAIGRRFLGAARFDILRPRWWTGRQQAVLERAGADPAALRLMEGRSD